MEEKKDGPVVNDEVELDKELNASIEAVKAGNVVVPPVQPKPEVKAEAPAVKTEEKPAETKEEPASKPQEGEAKKEEGYEFRIPNKGKFESDESYEKRIELLDLVKKRKLAPTPEQRQNLSEQIQTTKNQLKNLNGADKISNPLNKVESAKPEVEDEAMKADKERLKQLGGATKDDIAEIVRQERITADTKSTLEKFVERYPELKDNDVREVFFDFVDSNYNWNGKTGKALMTVLELARENMFRPSESIQERVLKGANVQEKINAMQFPGGALAKTGYSPERRKEIDELKATGMSEDKAIELLSE
jgi:membrane-associated HD superfamily phosphohydrolase